MSRLTSTLALVFFFFMSICFLAQAADPVVVGNTCAQLGETTMASDHKSIVACVYNDSGVLIWKATTGGATKQGGHCGYYSPSFNIPCNDTDLSKGICPSGYTMVSFVDGNGTNYFCIKN